MSESIRRRSSSRQLLQNLIRVTAQRSQEDAEEVERERRRRSRDKDRGHGGPTWPEPPHHGDPPELEEDLTASYVLVLEEDEGFSDWSHRLENRNDVQDDCGAGGVLKFSTPRWNQEEEKGEEEEEGCEERSGRFLEGSPAPHIGGSCRVEEQEEQMEWRSAETQWSPGGEEEEEELSFTREEEEVLTFRREEEEEEKIPNKRWSEGRSSEEVSSGGEESLTCYGPMSPTFKKLLIQFYPDEANSKVSTDGKCTILERAESLRRSTNNVKKTPLPVSKIDKKLQQYTHALEVSSKEGRSGCHPLPDVMGTTEPVSSMKTLFEAGDAWSQSPVSGTPSKEADGLKVGVADLINQWVKGSEDGSRCSSPCKPADVSSGKRFRFVVTGHGKYVKVSEGGGGGGEAAGQFYEDF
ncbi:lymphocyte-specific protein 1-like isoform X2 [Antennarius striatus]|uniref:lymphocyte-specific protein 1-like isoform X2 n=1 Tax=Antennarius striatus TaxID=241820 RepID=UPI0035B20CD8